MSGEVAPLRVCELCLGRGVVAPVLGLVVTAFVLSEGVDGRFLYAEAGSEGGPMWLVALDVVGVNSGGGGDFKAAAAITCLWSAGRGGGVPVRERMLEELPGRRGARPASFELRLPGDAGGDSTFSTPAPAMVPE